MRLKKRLLHGQHSRGRAGEAFEDRDGWTLRTKDGSLAAHHEHTLVITRRRPVLLTAA